MPDPRKFQHIRVSAEVKKCNTNFFSVDPNALWLRLPILGIVPGHTHVFGLLAQGARPLSATSTGYWNTKKRENAGKLDHAPFLFVNGVPSQTPAVA
jgi:hypothetical protein